MKLAEAIKQVDEHEGAIAIMGNSVSALSEVTKDEMSRLLFVADKYGTDFISTAVSLDNVLLDNTRIFINASRAKAAIS